MRSMHPIFAAAFMLIAGISRPSRDLSGKTPRNRGTTGRKAARSAYATDAKSLFHGWGTPVRRARVNTPHPPTTAELSKSRSMERKWLRAAALYPTSPAGIANAGIVPPPF